MKDSSVRASALEGETHRPVTEGVGAKRHHRGTMQRLCFRLSTRATFCTDAGGKFDRVRLMHRKCPLPVFIYAFSYTARTAFGGLRTCTLVVNFVEEILPVLTLKPL